MNNINLFNGDEINQKTILGHPSGLFTLFFTEMWERFSYYGMRAILVLFLISSIDNEGWGWDRAEALELYALYTGLVYVTPIFGGLIADRLIGYRKSIVAGAFLMTLGHAAMALEVFYDFYLYIGLALLILGNGLFKPNISSIVGQMYKDEGKLKDGAYTIFYMGINAGAFLGILLCGYIGENVNWHYGFGLAGIFMLFGMLQFHFGQNIFGDVGLKPTKSKKIEESIDGFLKSIYSKNIIYIIGGPATSTDQKYLSQLKQKYKSFNNVVFKGVVPHNNLKEYLENVNFHINQTSEGNYDKSVLETTVSGILNFYRNSDYDKLFPQEYVNFFKFNNGPVGLAEVISSIEKLNDDYEEYFRL